MNYVYAGYSVVLVVLALYAARIVMRGRALRRALPADPGPLPDEVR